MIDEFIMMLNDDDSNDKWQVTVMWRFIIDWWSMIDNESWIIIDYFVLTHWCWPVNHDDDDDDDESMIKKQ